MVAVAVPVAGTMLVMIVIMVMVVSDVNCHKCLIFMRVVYIV